jgi:hypothetical protein
MGAAAFVAATILGAVGAPASSADPSMLGAWVIPQHGHEAVTPKLVAGSNGTEWLFGSTNANEEPELQQVTSSGVFSVLPTQFESGTYGPVAMAVDGGAVWTLDTGAHLDELGPTGAVTHSFSTTQAPGSTAAGVDLATGFDGDLYVADQGEHSYDNGSIDQFTTAGAERVLAVPKLPDDDSSTPLALAVVGNTIFYAADDAGDIESVTTDGVTGGPYAGVSASPGAGSMTAGPDGDLWGIGAGSGDDIEQISPAGVLVHDYAIGQGPLGAITVGSDGRLWFTEDDQHDVGAIDPSTGTVTNYSLPLDSSKELQLPRAIAPGADNTIWYTGFDQSDQWTVGAISLTGAAPPPPPVPVEGISPGALPAFAITPLGFTSAPQVVTISNTGQADLTTGSPTFTGADPQDFSVSSSTCTGTVAPGSNCQITLDFTPHGLGTRSASLQIATNDSADGPLTVALSGTGVFVPPPPLPIENGGGVSTGAGGVGVAPTHALIVAGTLSFSGSSRTATVSRSGTVSLPLACSSAGSCTGTATLTATITSTARPHAVRVPRHATRQTRRTLILGSSHYSLSAGAHSHVVVHLSAKGRKLITAAKGHRLKVTAVIVQGTSKLTRSLILHVPERTSRTTHRR